MKKLLKSSILAILFATSAVCAQTQQNTLYAEFALHGNEYNSTVLCLNGKPFTGTREEAVAYEATKLYQPKDENLLIIERVFQKVDSFQLLQGPIMTTVFVKRPNGYWEEVAEFSNALPEVSANEDYSEIYITVSSTIYLDDYPVWVIEKSTWKRSIATYNELGSDTPSPRADWRPSW